MAKPYVIVTLSELNPRGWALKWIAKTMITILTMLLASALTTAQTPSDNPGRQLQAAIHKEAVVGDLTAAIEMYQTITARSGGDRTLAATALLRIGECQEKLGQNNAARNTYERVLRQFGDQMTIHAQARERLIDLMPATAQNEGPRFGVATATFPASVAAGRHVKYSGYIRTEGITEGWAGLWWRADGEPGTPAVAFDNMQNRGAVGTTPWTLYEIDLDIPSSTRHINFGVLHTGKGTAWFDTLRIEIDGRLYTDIADFDLDFESTGPRGFYTGGKGYKVEIDKDTAHTGKQSLRSSQVVSKEGEAAVQPR